MPALRILCVDDEPVVLKTLAMILRGHGHTVHTASTPEAAIEIISEHPVDVAIIDNSVCAARKLCLRQHLEKFQKSIRTILHSGSPDLEECVSKVDLLPKPCDPREISAKIEAIAASTRRDIDQ